MSLLHKTKLSVLLLLFVTIGGCTNGKIDPSNALTSLHLKKNEGYKNRLGWSVFEKLSIDDCEVHKSGGNSLLKWGTAPCDVTEAIKIINQSPQSIPIFYAAYHEYGSYQVGKISSFEHSNQTNEEITRILANLAKDLNNPEKVNAIYTDYESDRWSIGLSEVSELDFKKQISSFATKQKDLMSLHQKTWSDNQARYRAESEAAEKLKHKQNIASEKSINIPLWDNPTLAQKRIIDALSAIKFTIRNDDWVYANGRKFMRGSGLWYLKNSLDISLSSCSDVGAYIGEGLINKICINELAKDISEWGEAAKNSSISDAAWNAAEGDSIILYNPIKYEVFFSHWVGMARVYSSRGL